MDTVIDSKTIFHASSSSQPYAALPAVAEPRVPLGQSHDGVFANLKALPESTNQKTFEEFEPPSYQDVLSEETPPYLEATVITSVAEDGEVLVEGLPVGDFFTFLVNMIVSMSFDFIGFLLTTMLATSHAAKQGSRSGLGITLIRYGFLLKAKAAEAEAFAYKYDPENFESDEQIAAQNEWVAYMMMIVGFFVMLRANAEFVRAQRLKAVITATAEEHP
ncbi:hypothetical protein HDU76_013400 [Blyttiomyces sp. JEL0837]|nr:hypothetical protein HDU76_013400 [Blyttiomyces sp. JEL0837]